MLKASVSPVIPAPSTFTCWDRPTICVQLLSLQLHCCMSCLHAYAIFHFLHLSRCPPLYPPNVTFLHHKLSLLLLCQTKWKWPRLCYALNFLSLLPIHALSVPNPSSRSLYFPFTFFVFLLSLRASPRNSQTVVYVLLSVSSWSI